MNNFRIKHLITRGSSHDLHCEDAYCIFENDTHIICALGDGCSSGYNSWIASNKHMELVLEGCEDEILFKDNKHISKGIIHYVYSELYHIKYIRGVEMLSTIILLVINKKTEEYQITFAGDGLCCANGEITNVHDPNGDSVWYLSNVYDPKNPSNNITDYFDNFELYYAKCKKITGKGLNTISISTDGIDTFKNKYGTVLKEEAREFFFNNDKFDNLDNQLKRLYNIFIKGLNIDDKIPCINIDDFSMIKINKIIE